MKRSRSLVRVFALALGLSVAGAEAEPSLPQMLRDGFPMWDADHDGMLTQEEIDWGLASPEVKGPAAAALAAVYIGLGKATQTNLELPVSLEKAVQAAPQCQEYYRKALDLIANTPRVLFTNRVPNLKNFTQRHVGSCWALSSLATLIQRDPAEVAARFAARQNGFSFRFDDGSISVSAPTDGEIGVGSTTGHDGLWSIVFEKAAGERFIEKGQRPGPPLRAVSGAKSVGMLSALTGHKAERMEFESLREDAAQLNALRKALRVAVTQHRLVTTGRGLNELRVPGLLFDHIFAVLGYDMASDFVTIRDPHNEEFMPKGGESLENGYRMHEGVFRIRVPEFVRAMSSVSIEQPVHL